ncbi:MAG TPA: hypothetical protein VKS78_03935, partial [Roseiarcus sp.]|nr:hypothetical protein [Roseiarcus sp.]
MNGLLRRCASRNDSDGFHLNAARSGATTVELDFLVDFLAKRGRGELSWLKHTYEMSADLSAAFSLIAWRAF